MQIETFNGVIIVLRNGRKTGSNRLSGQTCLFGYTQTNQCEGYVANEAAARIQFGHNKTIVRFPNELVWFVEANRYIKFQSFTEPELAHVKTRPMANTLL